MSRRDVLLAGFLVVVWGVNFVALKWSLVEVPPLLLTGLRYLLSALPAVFFVRPPKVSVGVVVLYAAFLSILQSGLVVTAIHIGMPASLASLVMQTQVFFTFILAMLLLQERPRRAQIAGAIVAFAGIGVIGFGQAQSAPLLPLLITLAAAFSWGVANIITKKVGRIDMVALVVWSSLVVPLPMFVLSAIFETNAALAVPSLITLRGVLSVGFSSYIATLLAWIIWARLLSKYPANTVAPFTLLVPVFGIGSASIVLGEVITPIEIAGCAVVFAGLLLNVFGPRLGGRKAIPGTEVSPSRAG